MLRIRTGPWCFAGLLAALVAPASADIIGLNNGVNWTTNTNATGNPTFSGDSLTLTTNSLNEARSAYFNTKQNITSFTASFHYQDDPTASSNNPADGVTFIIQNMGLTALGASGGNKGYGTTITPAVAIILDVNGNDGTSAGSNGSLTSLLPRQDLATTTLLTQADVTVTYDGTTLQYTVTNPSDTSQTSTRSVAVNIPSVVGGNTAFIGFTGGTGSRVTTSTVSTFTFVPEPGSFGLLAAVAAGALMRRARRLTAK